MTFLRGFKRNVKPLFAAQAYKSLTELKSAITNYKQVYEENREITYDLPMEWGTKGNSPVNPASEKTSKDFGSLYNYLNSHGQYNAPDICFTFVRSKWKSSFGPEVTVRW
ncbi:hypothetical protein EVAR_46802_1 [Eumeta japonica]|uniref:Uncharacterized protein n=1 Tax=Eumeta variegata TaxID=151549 RepID=A0A4C1XDH7_EUMVA|nr:hypothetical protein EVAR_46802_1 [Eumeta japonica]